MREQIIVIIFFLTLLSVFAIITYFSNKKFEEKERLEKLEREEREKRQLEEEKRRRKENSNKWNQTIQSKDFGNVLKTYYKPNKEIKVIVGDYDSWGASFTNSVLKSMGINTFVVPTAYDIIDRIEAGEKYDIIITNHIYRQGSGEEVLDTLKNKDNFNIPIIILTVDQNARKHYVDNLGFDEYIPKALDSEKIIKTFPKVIKNLKFEKLKKQ